MKKTYYVYENSSTNPYFNLALEEYLLKNKLHSNYFLLWQNENTVVIGRNQNVVAEVDEQFATEHKIHIARRMTGGGAVYHDLGNQNYSFITDYLPGKNSTNKHFAFPIIKALNSLGIPAEYSGRNDIIVGDRKVSGMAQRVYKNRLLHHGCILFDTDLLMMKNVLKGKQRTDHRSVKSIDRRVSNLKNFVQDRITLEDFKRCSVEALCAEAEVQSLKLDAKDLFEYFGSERIKCL
ncbi:lipoate--protein ligase family protein [Clostridiales Family XIII bacterium ASD5510]|uniref:Lipoate--protein ligase family protein n=1 Tax=Hominibacterium faecale TaxID=2839743 RepID=A0A9J6QV53_9FIRM|nr:lipoate--protein ligase family protein [Hominibacterium faecale]MCU7378951.1 lipoate--protein ligase family protein [Hominibacterium faecale]